MSLSSKWIWPYLYRSGAHRVLESLYGGVGTLLEFHRVREPQNDGAQLRGTKNLEITPAFLDSLVQHFLQKGYDVISLDDVYERLSEARSERFVAFTFDDGYKDQGQLAYPIFKKYSLPLTIYIATGFPDRNIVLWWYLFEDILLNHSEIEFQDQTYSAKTLEEKNSVFTILNQKMLGLNKEQWNGLLTTLCNKYRCDPFKYVTESAMNWEELRALSQDPLVTIGCHTVTHPILNRMDASTARHEIDQSRKILEHRLGRKIEHFAYPFGGRTVVSDREFGIVKELGFKTAVTTRSGNIFRNHARHKECLPRMNLSGPRATLEMAEKIVSGARRDALFPFQRVITA